MFKFHIFLFIVLFSDLSSARIEMVDVNKDMVARQSILEQKFTIEGIATIESKVIRGNEFKFDPDQRFVNRAAELPSELDPENNIAQEVIIMFLGSEWNWLCELRLNIVFSNTRNGQVILNEEFSSYSSHQCYPRI